MTGVSPHRNDVGMTRRVLCSKPRRAGRGHREAAPPISASRCVYRNLLGLALGSPTSEIEITAREPGRVQREEVMAPHKDDVTRCRMIRDWGRTVERQTFP